MPTPASPVHALRGALIASIAPLIMYAVMRLAPGADPRWHLPLLHLIVGVTLAVLGTGIGLFIALAGVRLRNLQVLLLALSFVSLGLLQAAHGLSTPGMLMDMTSVPTTTAQLSVLLAAAWLYLSSLPSGHGLLRPLARLENARPGALPVLATGLLAALSGLALARPDALRFVPVDDVPTRYVIAGITLGLAAVSVRHYARSFRYARLPLQISTVYGALWLAGAQIVLTTGTVWNVSWWLYHFLLYAGVGAGLIGLLSQYRRADADGQPDGSLISAVQGLWQRDADALLRAGVSRGVRALLVTLEQHDPYTAGHSYRVAREGVRLGRAAGCTPEQLRALAQGGLAHDLGKLDVGAQVLNSPGALSPEERRAIEGHPALGHARCQHLGFLPDELDVVRHHHERWDGSGYPDRLAGAQIPRLARILAIADVHDALTSERSYRQPWSEARAQALIASEAGKHFDPELVQVWLALRAEPAEEDAATVTAPRLRTEPRAS